MFINLYHGSTRSEFRDYNFSYFLGRLEQVCEQRIATQFREKLRGGTGWDPSELAAIFEFTLSERVCESFFRDVKALPATKRDFYLSKLLQFLALSIDASVEDDPEAASSTFRVFETLEEVLDEIPERLLANLHQFDLWQFQADISAAEGSRRRIEEIEAFLTWEKYLQGPEENHADAERRDSPSTAELAERRRGLLDSYRTMLGGTAKSVYSDRGVVVDKRDFYRWLNGSLPASSQMTRRIEEFIQMAIRQKRHFK